MNPPNAHRLASGLQRLENAADYEVRAHIVFNLFDRLRSLFIEPDPVFAIESSTDPNELKFLMRESERALTAKEMSDALLALSESAAAAPMIATVVLSVVDDQRFTVNIPARSAAVRVDRRRRRVILSWFALRKR